MHLHETGTLSSGKFGVIGRPESGACDVAGPRLYTWVYQIIIMSYGHSRRLFRRRLGMQGRSTIADTGRGKSCYDFRGVTDTSTDNGPCEEERKHLCTTVSGQAMMQWFFRWPINRVLTTSKTETFQRLMMTCSVFVQTCIYIQR